MDTTHQIMRTLSFVILISTMVLLSSDLVFQQLPISYLYSRVGVVGEVKNDSNSVRKSIVDPGKALDNAEVINKALNASNGTNASYSIEKELASRRMRMLTYCKEKNINDSGIGHVLVDDRRKFLYCVIHKVASSAMKKALINSTGILPVNRTSNLKINNPTLLQRYGLRMLSNYPKTEIEKRIRNYYKVIFVRNPFHRLLSAFRDRFHIFEDREYFRHTYGRKIIKKYRRNPSMSSLRNATDVKFVEFAQYVIDEAHLGHPLNSHWQKFQQSCHPCHIKYDLVGHLETIDDDVVYFMDKINATRHTKPSTMYGPSSHGTTMTTESVLKTFYATLPNRLIKDLQKIYEDDFLMFGYTTGLQTIL